MALRLAGKLESGAPRFVFRMPQAADSRWVHQAGIPKGRVMTEPKNGQRIQASHLVEAELAHLEWATRQPARHVLSTGYWRRRVLIVKAKFELTRQQRERAEMILMRLGPVAE